MSERLARVAAFALEAEEVYDEGVPGGSAPTCAGWRCARTGKRTRKNGRFPINMLVSKLSSFAVFPASYQIGFGGVVAQPAIGPSWKIRGAINSAAA